MLMENGRRRVTMESKDFFYTNGKSEGNLKMVRSLKSTAKRRCAKAFCKQDLYVAFVNVLCRKKIRRSWTALKT